MKPEIREALERPFSPEQIKQRQGNFGQTLDYIEGHEVIQRLNEAFEGDWSFEILHHEISEDEVIVQGRLTAGGIVKEAFGGSKITHNRDDGSIVCLSDNFKASCTDCIKRAAVAFGVALHLYRNDQPSTSNTSKNQPAKSQDNGGNGGYKGNGNGGNGGNGDNGNGNGSARLTNKQLQAIYKIGKDKGLNQGEIKNRSRDMFSKMPDFLTKEEASSMIKNLIG